MSVSPTVDRPSVTQDSPPRVVSEASQSLEPTARDATTPSSGRPSFTITDAATACAVSRKTITRKLADLAEHGAAKDEDGVWRIPVEALLAVGLHPGRSLAPASRPSAAVPTSQTAAPSRIPVAPVADMVSIPRDRWDDLRIRLARAEAEASERALALADARLALRALTAGPASDPHPTRATAPAPAAAVAGPGGPDGAQPSAANQPITLGVAAAQEAPARTLPGPAPVGSVATQPPSTPAPSATAVQPPAGISPDLAAARSQAAQTGGYVPANPGAPARKRRWWQSS